MDPVLIGAGAAVLVKIVSGVVATAHRWLDKEVEIARITSATLTGHVLTGHGLMSRSASRNGGGHDGGRHQY